MYIVTAPCLYQLLDDRLIDRLGCLDAFLVTYGLGVEFERRKVIEGICSLDDSSALKSDAFLVYDRILYLVVRSEFRVL